MKNFVSAMLILFALQANAQEQESKKVSDALKTGNVEAITSLLTSNVDLTLINEEDVYPKDQVSGKLTKFFTAHKPSGFAVKHQGTSKLNDFYYIGDLSTVKGAFRVTYFIRKDGNAFRVSQFRIETIED